MLINTYLDTEDFVHLYYPEDEPPAAQGCGAGARMASKYPPRPPTPEYVQLSAPSSEMSERERYRAPAPPEPPPHRVRAADLYPRLRTHYDEPGLDVGFTPICGEFVQWVGRTADGGTIAMSNYRLHAQPRRRSGPGASMPLRAIDTVEIRDLLQLFVFCKNGRTLKCTFNSGEQCLEWWRRLNGALVPIGSLQETFAAAYAAWAKEQPLASIHRTLIRASQQRHHWFANEVQRLGFTLKNAWRVTEANTEYKLCSSYPPQLIVPASIGDVELDSVAKFRAMRRIPAVVWRHRGNGAVIARSSQPEVGWLGWRNDEDERLLAAFVAACTADRGLQPDNVNKQVKLLIMDARSYTSAVTNRARGGGCEYQQYYTGADIQFMSLPNIHNVRRSFQQMRALTAEPNDQNNWHGNLERTLWLQYVSGVCRAAAVAARAVLAARPVLVHCSDGWDRTSQIVSTAQLILDPYYRTLEGFRVLIEREWLDFGHKFADRCGHPFRLEDASERSPIFLQWLDVVYQMMYQYPCSFEFNESYLIKLATHVYSCMFGTFLCNTRREREEIGVYDTTAQLWELLQAPAYRNHLYFEPHNLDQVLWPETYARSMQFWWSMYGGEREEPDDDQAEHNVTTERHAPTSGLMTKTRSCDNLLNESGKITKQRRCSDPSIAPDVIKLSCMVGADEVRRECRGALTDSCVDDLPVLPISENVQHQVDGLNPDHFENQPLPRDIASGSSSLERELVGPPNIGQVIDHSLGDKVTDNLNKTSKRYSKSCDEADGLPKTLYKSDVKLNYDNRISDGTSYDSIFECDGFGDAVGMAEATRGLGRLRSFSWRSVSESSNQSSNGFDTGDTPPKAIRPSNVQLSDQVNSHETSPIDNDISHEASPIDNLDLHEASPIENHNLLESPPVDNQVLQETSLIDNHNLHEASPIDSCNSHEASPIDNCNSHDASPIDNHNSTEGDLVNHNVVSELTNHNRKNVTTNGTSHQIEASSSKFLEVQLKSGATSSSISSESEGEALPQRRAHYARARVPSQQTLCPASPRRVCCHCTRPASVTSGIETSGESGSSEACWCGSRVTGGGGAAQCLCGAGSADAATGGVADPLDGLAPTVDAVQARLHQIILFHKKQAEDLIVELRQTKELLRQATLRSPDTSCPPAPDRAPQPSAPPAQNMRVGGSTGTGSGSGSGTSVGGSGSSSGSASEVEVGEEARGVVWVPDSAAPRCQYCRNHFWLARRRHHCRRCGGIFCSSCSEMSSWGECGAVRVCRRCRAQR